MSSSLTSAQRRELKGAFDAFDTDASGRISQKELGNVFKALNIKVTDSQLNQLVKDMDADGSGEVEFDEFCRVMSASFFKKHSQEELRAAFQRFDQDGSGYIQAEELESIMQQMGRRMDRSQIDAMVRSLDKTGDGKIEFDEFARLFE